MTKTSFGQGYCHFPDHYDQAHFKKLTNEEKRMKRKNGQIIGHEWVKLGPNEPLDCRVYALASLEQINPNFAKRAVEIAVEVERIGLNVRAIEQHTPQIQPVQRGRRVRSSGISL